LPPAVNVKAMLLFDAVDMHWEIDAATIPNNVGPVLHVMRKPESNSRIIWGNTAEEHDLPHLLEKEKFDCTHGGMGGVPWTVPTIIENPDHAMWRRVPDQSRLNQYIVEGPVPPGTNVTYAQDARESEKVWRFVQKFINQHGFHNLA
jgi:hypothetical protein